MKEGENHKVMHGLIRKGRDKLNVVCTPKRNYNMQVCVGTAEVFSSINSHANVLVLLHAYGYDFGPFESLSEDVLSTSLLRSAAVGSESEES